MTIQSFSFLFKSLTLALLSQQMTWPLIFIEKILYKQLNENVLSSWHQTHRFLQLNLPFFLSSNYKGESICHSHTPLRRAWPHSLFSFLLITPTLQSTAVWPLPSTGIILNEFTDFVVKSYGYLSVLVSLINSIATIDLILSFFLIKILFICEKEKEGMHMHK